MKDYIFKNFNKEEVSLSTERNWTTVEDGTPVSGKITLKPYETLILKK